MENIYWINFFPILITSFSEKYRVWPYDHKFLFRVKQTVQGSMLLSSSYPLHYSMATIVTEYMKGKSIFKYYES